jgi:GTP cyclohydrolase IA
MMPSPQNESTEQSIQRLPDVFTGLSKQQKVGIAGRLIIESAKGENPRRPGLLKTPERFAKAMSFLLSGYDTKPENVVGEGIFPCESRGVVSVNNIEFYSLCEHHMLPFWGNASVAYYPSDKIIGLSKIPRLINLFARRLQVQEQLTHEVAHALGELIQPRAVAVRISGQHLCMMMRGVEKQNSTTVSESSIGIDRLTNLEQQRLFSALEGN